MRTTKVVTSVVVALALLYSAGCDSCQYYQVIPADGSQPAVVYDCPPPVVGCPPPRAVTQARGRNARRVYGRRVQRFARPGRQYVVVTPAGTQTYQDLGTATLVTDPGYVPTVVAGAETAPVMVAAPATAPAPVVVAPQPKTRIVYRRGKIQKQPRRARVTAPIYNETVVTPVYAGPVYSDGEAVTTTVTVVTDDVITDAPAEAVIVTEPAPEEPSYAKYLAPNDEPAPEPIARAEAVEPADFGAEAPAIAAAPAPEPATIAVQAPQAPIAPPVPGGEPLPADIQASIASPMVVPPVMPAGQPQPVDQMAQVSPYQVGGQQVTPEQLYQQIVMLQQMYQQLMQGNAGGAVVSEPMYVLAGPVDSGWEPGTFPSSYCPPEICPPSVPIVCAPGQNLSECFTMSEYQLLNSPQIYVPEAMKPLPIAVQPAAMPNTALLNPTAPAVAAPQFPAAPPQVPPQAPAAGSVRPVAPPALPALAAPAPQVGGTSKYEALVPPAQITRPSRPEVSMPAPLSNGSTMPQIAPTQEIESAVDAMLSRDPANPGMLK